MWNVEGARRKEVAGCGATSRRGVDGRLSNHAHEQNRRPVSRPTTAHRARTLSSSEYIGSTCNDLGIDTAKRMSH